MELQSAAVMTLEQMRFKGNFLNSALYVAEKLKGVMKNDVSIVHKFLSTNTYSR